LYSASPLTRPLRAERPAAPRTGLFVIYEAGRIIHLHIISPRSRPAESVTGFRASAWPLGLGDLFLSQLAVTDDRGYRPQAGIPAGPVELRELVLLVPHTLQTRQPAPSPVMPEFPKTTRRR
jgi:hypothetical protein